MSLAQEENALQWWWCLTKAQVIHNAVVTYCFSSHVQHCFHVLIARLQRMLSWSYMTLIMCCLPGYTKCCCHVLLAMLNTQCCCHVLLAMLHPKVWSFTACCISMLQGHLKKNIETALGKWFWIYMHGWDFTARLWLWDVFWVWVLTSQDSNFNLVPPM